MENINILNIAKNAKEAYLKTMNLNVEIKNKALSAIIKEIEENKNLIFEANNKDLTQAQIMLDEGKINQATYNRLKINENKINDLITGLNDLIKLDDPVNKIV